MKVLKARPINEDSNKEPFDWDDFEDMHNASHEDDKAEYIAQIKAELENAIKDSLFGYDGALKRCNRDNMEKLVPGYSAEWGGDDKGSYSKWQESLLAAIENMAELCAEYMMYKY